MNNKTVFVGLSGGVDSSVAALRLKQQGYRVVGVFIKVWHPDFLVCNWEQERLDAMRVAAHLEIPFLTCNAEKAYKDDVANYFISEYLAGRTPNPDIMCNRYVKFGAFLDFARENGADYIATGHYAQKIHNANHEELHRGIDTGKDQSYFLHSLSNEQLAFTLLPVGNSEKNQIRAQAASAKIPTATKKDSQGVCFLGHIDIKEFLSHYVDLTVGDVLDVDGNVIGSHEGSLIYTIGQRHGFTVHNHAHAREAYYVVSKDTEKNTITVSETKPVITTSKHLVLSKLSLRQEIKVGEEYEAQTRYRQTPFRVRVVSVESYRLELEVLSDTDAAASGQSCVLYQGMLCLGGGIIV